MALQTALRILLGISMEGEDQLSGGRSLRVIALRGFLCVGVGLACAVAHLATGDRVGVRWRKRGMPGFSVLLRLGFVARPAAVRPGVNCVCRRCHGRDCD